MFKQHPNIPYFLNLFPYDDPLALELCLNCPKPSIKNKITIISKSKGIITKCAVNIKLFRSTNTYFELVLSFSVGNNLPIVDSAGKSNATKCASKYIRLLF